MKIRINNYLKLGLITLLICWLFIGFYNDHEIDYMYGIDYMGLYYKSKPSFSIELTHKSKLLDLDISNAYVSIFFYLILPFFLIQLMLTLLCFGTKIKKYRIWQLLLHFIINISFTYFGIIGMQVARENFATISIGVIVIIINYSIFYLLQIQWRMREKKEIT